MYYLPKELQEKIYEYDNTYHEHFKNRILPELKYILSFWKVHMYKYNNLNNDEFTRSDELYYQTLAQINRLNVPHQRSYDNCIHYVSEFNEKYEKNRKKINVKPYLYGLPISLFDHVENKIHLIFERIRFSKKIVNLPFKLLQ